MERLTKRDSGGNAAVDCDVCELGESRLANCGVLKCRNRLKDRLAYYEDAEEQGRLIVLPCKVGDAIFLVERGNILEEKVLGFIEAGHGLIMNVTYRNYVSRPKCENIGKLLDDEHLSLFLSREEAEKALEGMK